MPVNISNMPKTTRGQRQLVPGGGAGVTSPSSYTFWTNPANPTAMFIAIGGETDNCITTIQAAGWNVFIVDRPAEGYDIIAGDLTGLNGWAQRINAGRDVVQEFCVRANAAATRWLGQGRFRPESMYVVGTSRAGFLASHYASRYKVAGFVAFCPITKLGYSGLTEFNGINATLLSGWDSIGRSPAQRYCPGWTTITPDDTRVGTAECVAWAAAVGSTLTFVNDSADSGHGTPSQYVAGGNALIAMEAARVA